MSVEQIIDVPPNGQLTIQIPSALKNQKRVRLVINEINEALEDKILLLQKACKDKDFVSDLAQINKDFDFAESGIEE